MKKGDVVKFKKTVDSGDEKARFFLLENPDGGRVLVQFICEMNHPPTYRYNVDELEICGEEPLDINY